MRSLNVVACVALASRASAYIAPSARAVRAPPRPHLAAARPPAPRRPAVVVAAATPVDEPETPAELAADFWPEAPSALATEFWRNNWARLAILVCAAVYGTNFSAVKTLDTAVAPSLSASLRFGLASLAALPIVFDALRDRPEGDEIPMPRALALGAAEIGCVNALGYICQSVGLETVHASLSAFVCSLAVVVVPILDAVVLGKRTSRSTWVGAALAAAGVALLSFDASGGGDAAAVAASIEPLDSSLLAEAAATAAGASAPSLGLALTLVQPWCFGYGFWRTERLLRQVSDAAACAESGACDGAIADCETEAACAIVGFDLQRASLTCAALQLVAVKAAADVWLLGDVVVSHALADHCVGLPGSPAELMAQLGAPSVLAAVAWTGLVATFATVLVETVALSKISAQESTVLFSTEPLWGASFAAATLGERLDASSFAGGALIIAACLFSSLGGFGGDDGDGGGGGALLDAIDVDALL